MTNTIRIVVSLVLMGGCVSQPPSAPTPEPPGVDCARFPSQSVAPYVLPYETGQSATVSRTIEHGPPQLFAVDFLRTIGTVVVSARDGRVVEVEARWPDSDHQFGHENRVFIEHDDGTVARYFHLTQSGVDVQLGQRVTQGQRIGKSGNSGNSTAPHLHFDVVERRCQASWPDGPYSDPCHSTVPLTFRNTRPHSCGVLSGEVYTALM